jgi:hypothetical protein
MTTYSFPDIEPTSSMVELVSNTRTFRSPLTNAVQTTGRKGSLWRISLQFRNLTGAEQSVMRAFLSKLNGQEHRFYLQDHSYTRRGAGGGTLRVNGAGQSGNSLVLNGATTSVTNYLRDGDYLAFNNELHIATADTSSDASSNVIVSIAPPIRKSTNNDDLVDINVPVLGVFMLGSEASWSNDNAGFSNFSFSAVEDVLA